jgi:hypothetical protein
MQEPPLFTCNVCNYSTNRKSQFDRHIQTNKHINSNKFNSTTNYNYNYNCICGKKYKHQSSLYAHKKKCSNETKTENEIIKLLIKENADFKKIILKVIENGVNINTNNNNNNTTTIQTKTIENKTFNLNVFLNETCKDAMNITDFVSSIKLTLEDLENTGKQGYIQGITNIFLKNLNNLEQHMRPLHCSDLKREVFYIKNNNEWTKEFETKPMLTKAIKVIANENIKQIKNWRDKNPNCTDSESKKNNLYLKIVGNSMNGLTEEEGHKNINKIINNVAKEVLINKT